ncbi:unnamed protein product [Rotaria magnacalcarata]|uniref:Uncharacterized protein n=1 Tax=Rotaria magnacalcarata TaxID=392030 RepID=A0A816X8G7_9BILA|nr:unnamed protein product [Rotaria magnacalcarata]
MIAALLTVLINLTYLQFCLKDICHYPPTSLIDLVPTRCQPSNILHLNVNRVISNIKCFSVTSFRRTQDYENQIVPLLRQTSFIGGDHLVNDIFSKMPYLHTYIFNIISEIITSDEELLPTPFDVTHALVQRRFKMNCHTDYTIFFNDQHCKVENKL